MRAGEGLLYALIIGCEIAFWVALFGGLAVRYLLRRERLSRLLLLCVPLIDLALLAFTVLDLRAGSTATFAHGLATAYVAFTVAFGGPMMDWADRYFAHRFAGAPAPPPPPSGWAAVRHELKLWGRCIVAVIIVYVLLTGVFVMVDDRVRTRALEAWYSIPLGTVFFWFVFGPLWSLVFFRRAR
jgi:hypothetical protein